MRKIEKIKKPSETLLQTHKRVAAYCRISMECNSLNNSLENQISYYKELITNTKGYDLVKVYYDCGISGTNTKNREAFNEMIYDAKAGKIDLIYTKSISRFARNTIDLLNSIRLLKNLNVGVIFEKENINTLSSDGEFLLTIFASFAQLESESISENVRWARRKKFEMGIDQYKSMFAFGYKDGKYTIVEKEAKVVRKVFKLFNEGFTYTEIAKIINKGNIKTRNGKDWNYNSIKDMLSNEKYMGDSLFQKRYVANTLNHYTKRNKGELNQYYAVGTHPVIISKGDFEKAKERIKYINENKVKCHKQSKWFTGLVKCAVCGRSMIVHNSKFLRCIGACKYRTCDNKQTLKMSELEDFLNNEHITRVDINKIEKIVLKKARLTRFSRKGIKPGLQLERNIRKEDFEIIWKQ